jgi:hypothetical protein
MHSMGGDLTVEFGPDGTSFFRLRTGLAPGRGEFMEFRRNKVPV